MTLKALTSFGGPFLIVDADAASEWSGIGPGHRTATEPGAFPEEPSCDYNRACDANLAPDAGALPSLGVAGLRAALIRDAGAAVYVPDPMRGLLAIVYGDPTESLFAEMPADGFADTGCILDCPSGQVLIFDSSNSGTGAEEENEYLRMFTDQTSIHLRMRSWDPDGDISITLVRCEAVINVAT